MPELLAGSGVCHPRFGLSVFDAVVVGRFTSRSEMGSLGHISPWGMPGPTDARQPARTYTRHTKHTHICERCMQIDISSRLYLFG